MKPSHEMTDIKVRPLLYFMGGLVLIILAVMGVSKWFLGRTSRKIDAESKSMPKIYPPQLSGPPRQENPHADLVALEKNEKLLLNSYGWVDETKGIVRIPIDRAMDLVLKEGLPTRGEKK